MMVTIAAGLAAAGQAEAATTIADAYTRISAGETIVAPFTDSDGVASTGSYSGLVEIAVSGVGQSAATSYNDAFHIYQGGGALGFYYQLGIGTPLKGFTAPNAGANARQYVTFIDGVGAVAAGTAPAYSADHKYHFVVDLGNFAAAPLVFGVLDGVYSDNSGAYTITAYQLRAGAAPGVPEPASWALMLGGFALLGTATRRRPATAAA